MYYCLNRDEVDELLTYKINGNKFSNKEFETLIFASQAWIYKLGSLNYSIGQILLRRKANGENCFELIDLLYNLQNEMYFEIHEVDDQLIDGILSSLSDPGLSIEENLVKIQTRIMNYQYGR